MLFPIEIVMILKNPVYLQERLLDLRQLDRKNKMRIHNGQLAGMTASCSQYRMVQEK